MNRFIILTITVYLLNALPALADPQQPGDLRNILSDSEMTALRSAYDPSVMLNIGTSPLNSIYPPISGMTEFISQQIYGANALSGRDRERSIVLLLAAKSDSLPLAAHLYWGMMEGLDPDDLGKTFLIVAAYNGIDCFKSATATEAKVLQIMKSSADAGGQAAAILSVMKAILAAFPS